MHELPTVEEVNTFLQEAKVDLINIVKEAKQSLTKELFQERKQEGIDVIQGLHPHKGVCNFCEAESKYCIGVPGLHMCLKCVKQFLEDIKSIFESA